MAAHDGNDLNCHELKTARILTIAGVESIVIGPDQLGRVHLENLLSMVGSEKRKRNGRAVLRGSV